MMIQRRMLVPAAQRQIRTDWLRGKGSHRKKQEVRKMRGKGGGSTREKWADHKEDGGRRRSRPPGGVLISWNVCDVAELSGLMTVALNKYLTGTIFFWFAVEVAFMCLNNSSAKAISVKEFFRWPKAQLQLCELHCSQVWQVEQPLCK